MIRILIVEDHEVVCDALAKMLGDASDIEVVATAASIRDALPLLDQHRPELVLADLALADGSGIELARALRRDRRKGRVLILTGHGDAFTAAKALADGAIGYVLKSQSPRELLEAIRTVATGATYVAHQIVEKLAAERSGSEETSVDSNSGIAALSRREQDVFRQVLEGHRSKDIAHRLSINVKTVETHRMSINRKLAVKTTADVIRFAVARGFSVVPRVAEEEPRSN